MLHLGLGLGHHSHQGIVHILVSQNEGLGVPAGEAGCVSTAGIAGVIEGGAGCFAAGGSLSGGGISRVVNLQQPRCLDLILALTETQVCGDRHDP